VIALRHILPGSILALSLSAGAHADTSASATPATPSAGHRWHGRHHHGFQHVLSKLNLTEAQKAEVKSIYAQSRPRFQALMADSRSTRESLATTMPTDVAAYESLLAKAKSHAADRVQLESDVWGQVYAVLTPEQQQQIPGVVAAEKAARATRKASWQGQHGQR
jgi:Spy/CpxP family protein refolding chaperone